MGPVSTDDFYELKEPTSWAEPPTTYSFSSLQALGACPRRWQLVHSAWGSFARFPERPQPAAIEGQIVHEALDLLARELGLRGRPSIASAGFREAVASCGFWSFFASRVDDWNQRLASHPRAGPRYVLRTKPRDLANQAVCLFREQYAPGSGQPSRGRVSEAVRANGGAEAFLSLLRSRGTLSEIRLEHPSMPVAGVIDLVSLDPDGSTTVADFKTGSRKPAHEDQVLLYSLLWWRTTGDIPKNAVVQYLDSSWSFSPTEADLVRSEKSLAKQVAQAKDVLCARPALAAPGQDCRWCPVRPRCNEGWSRGEQAVRADSAARAIDVEITVSSKPTPTGFVGTRASGEEVSIVFDAAVGSSLPAAEAGDRFRIVDAARREGGKEIALLPWTEMYRL